MTYIELLLAALVTIYVVDISGFTDSWRGLVAELLGVKALKPLPPFDCGKCMAWWVCIIASLVSGHFTWGTIAFSALMSLLSVPLGQAMIFIREGLNLLIGKLINKW